MSAFSNSYFLAKPFLFGTLPKILCFIIFTGSYKIGIKTCPFQRLLQKGLKAKKIFVTQNLLLEAMPNYVKITPGLSTGGAQFSFGVWLLLLLLLFAFCCFFFKYRKEKPGKKHRSNMTATDLLYISSSPPFCCVQRAHLQSLQSASLSNQSSPSHFQLAESNP